VKKPPPTRTFLFSIHPRVGLLKWTSSNDPVGFVSGRAVQLWPSVVCKNELPPEAHPVLASIKRTDFRKLNAPLVCRIHLTPPSVVFRIVPLSPTTQPVFSSTNWTSDNSEEPV